MLYVGSRVGFRWNDVQASLRRLEELGVVVHDSRECWDTAADLKREHTMALGDAYALATANAVSAMLLVGADDYFDEFNASIERFRKDPV